MNKVRRCFGFSFAEFEVSVLARLRELLGECLVRALSRMDCELLNKRDPSRYQVKGFEQPTLETAMGQTITFERRQYFDRDKGQYVFLLDEALAGVEQLRGTTETRNRLVQHFLGAGRWLQPRNA